MSARRAIILLATCFLFACAVPGSSYASGAREQETATLSQKIQTSHLSGIDLWIAVMYNGDRVLYAVVVTLVMAALGTTLAFLTDLVLKALGMEVSRLSHRE